ncbi:MAG: hypothetical protein QMD77_04255 [Patescibacteria group bacterium]|nr:hypothetical protein [Patescibacteria group bacterium]
MKTQIDNRLMLRFKLLSKVFATLVFVVGLLAVCGWQFDIEVFQRISPNLPIIAPNTAISFVFVGLFIFSLGWMKREGYNPLKVSILFFSLLVSLLGVVTLLEYFSGMNFGIDNIFFRGKMGGNVVRMSPQSAFNFAIVGLVLFLFTLRKKRQIFWGQVLIVAAGVTALVSLLGFIYGVTGL